MEDAERRTSIEPQITSGSFTKRKSKASFNLSGSQQADKPPRPWPRSTRSKSRISRLVDSVRGQAPSTYQTMARTPLVTDWSDPDSYVLQGDIESEDSAVARSNSCILTVVKWVFTAILLVLILVSSVLSKTSFARIASSLANITMENGEITRKDKHSVAFVQLVFILIVPQILTILKAFFLGILGKGTKRFPWPSTSAIIKVMD